MHLKQPHTIWLTFLTTLILLVSSVVNSAPLMNLEMMQSSVKISTETVTQAKDHCGSHSVEMNMSPQTTSSSSMNCADSSGMVHNCCTSACSFIYVSLPIPTNQSYPQTYRANIGLETAEPVVQVSHDLYRPPIA